LAHAPDGLCRQHKTGVVIYGDLYLSGHAALLYTDNVDNGVDDRNSPSRCCEGTRVQAYRLPPPLAAPAELDPALLAFVKCHITSFVKWDILRALAEQVGFWTEPSVLARHMGKPVSKISEALDELVYEGIVEVSGPPGARLYRLREGEPTTVVLNRLIAKVTRSQELRRIVVTHILQAAVA